MQTDKINSDLQQQCRERVPKEKDPMAIFRTRVLASGVGCLKSIGRTFRILDKDNSRRLDKEELIWIIKNRNIGPSYLKGQKLEDAIETMADELMKGFDRDGDGKISFDEFLFALRPTMKDQRKELVMKAFAKMDKSGDGVITVEDLMGMYNVSNHPQYKSGEKTERQLIVAFLDSFELEDNKGKDEITIERGEWVDYFCTVSASIDNDAYFDLMMRNAWKL